MKKFNIIVDVGLKPTIKDIKALTLKEAVGHITDIKDFQCRLQNRYLLEFSAENQQQAEKTVQLIAEEVLANSVIETYNISWNQTDE